MECVRADRDRPLASGTTPAGDVGERPWHGLAAGSRPIRVGRERIAGVDAIARDASVPKRQRDFAAAARNIEDPPADEARRPVDNTSLHHRCDGILMWIAIAGSVFGVPAGCAVRMAGVVVTNSVSRPGRVARDAHTPILVRPHRESGYIPRK